MPVPGWMGTSIGASRSAAVPSAYALLCGRPSEVLVLPLSAVVPCPKDPLNRGPDESGSIIGDLNSRDHFCQIVGALCAAACVLAAAAGEHVKQQQES